MVIQDDSDAPQEVSVMKTPQSDAKKYVIVKNHVRELPITEHASSGHSSAQDDTLENELSAKKKKKYSKKDSKVIAEESQQNAPTNECIHAYNELRDIRRELQEFKKELHECFNRLGAKLENIVQTIDGRTRHNLKDTILEEECRCRMNTKIIFDEDGQKAVTETNLATHTCLQKLKRRYSDVARNVDIHQLVMAQKSNIDTSNLAVEYEEQNISLPEDLMSLTNILQDSQIGISYRNKVIDKVKLLKQEHLNEIKFNRPSIIEKLKSSSNCEEVFEFKGANIFSLPGYPDWK